MTVLIAGGGIGGLTLALSLHQIGIPAKVFESVPELRPLGVGINVLPHAVRELIELGLHDALDAHAVRTKELAYFSKHGKPIWSEPRGIEAGYKWPQFSVHRGTLQQILLDAAIERLGKENILTSHHLTGWTETENGVRAEFIDKATGKSQGHHEGALLIAADGIHSAIRDKLYPGEGPPIWNGRILWRGITDSDAFLPGLIENCPHAYEYPLVDRDPVAQWTFGRVTLMGDAAHPMYPIGSNGASQAILDARVITREILAKGTTNAALVAYEAERRPATTDLVMLNRRNGPEQVMQMVEERAPNGYDVVTDVLSLQELEDIAANYKRVAGFQVEGLNAKPPIVQITPEAPRVAS